MDVTDEGMDTDSREVHWPNASDPMDVTPDGMVTDSREEHWENAYNPMDVTEPKLMLARFTQLRKELFPIFVTPDCTTRDVIWLDDEYHG